MPNRSKMTAVAAAALLGGSAITLALLGGPGQAEETSEVRVPLTFSGGHATDPRDHGRPVVLVAGGLGVKPAVFRKAFSGVTPARNGRPTGAEARANKQALLKVLGPYGVTNERLDEVSDYYRYRPQDGELWKNTAAEGYAIVEAGKITKLVITRPGAGYSSTPEVTAEGFADVPLKATLRFSKDLKKNGSIASVELAPVEARPPGA